MEPDEWAERFISKRVNKKIMQWDSELLRNRDCAPLLFRIRRREGTLYPFGPLWPCDDPVAGLQDAVPPRLVPSGFQHPGLIKFCGSCKLLYRPHGEEVSCGGGDGLEMAKESFHGQTTLRVVNDVPIRSTIDRLVGQGAQDLGRTPE